MEFKANSSKETKKFSKIVLERLVKNKNNVLLLVGELGSGKTTFVQGLGLTLGIKERILSPTFVLNRSYSAPIKKYGFTRLEHFDFYRLKSIKEIEELGFFELIKNPEVLVVAEWPELISNIIFNNQKINMFFEYGGEKERIIRII